MTMSSIEIRRARTGDASSILSIQTDCGLSPWPISAYEAEVIREDSIVLTASTDIGVLIGFILGRVHSSDLEAPPHAEIYNLGVLGDHRVKGVGSALLNGFLDLSAAYSVNQVFLEVRRSNIPAINFYAAHGFVKTGERKNFYSDPVESANTMTLEVEARVSRNKYVRVLEK